MDFHKILERATCGHVANRHVSISQLLSL